MVVVVGVVDGMVVVVGVVHGMVVVKDPIITRWLTRHYLTTHLET